LHNYRTIAVTGEARVLKCGLEVECGAAPPQYRDEGPGATWNSPQFTGDWRVTIVE